MRLRAPNSADVGDDESSVGDDVDSDVDVSTGATLSF